MTTRGLIGIRFKDKNFLIYNHYDSYPEALGVRLLSELKEVPDWEKAKEYASTLVGIPETRDMSGVDRLVETEIRRQMPNSAQVEIPETMYDLCQIGCQKRLIWPHFAFFRFIALQKQNSRNSLELRD